MPRTLAELAAVSDRQQLKLLHESLNPVELLDVGTVLWMIANYAERYAAPRFDAVYQVDVNAAPGSFSQSVKDAMHQVQALSTPDCRDEIVAQLLSIQRTISQVFSFWTGEESATVAMPAPC